MTIWGMPEVGAKVPYVRRERDRHGNVRLYWQPHRRAHKVRIRASEGTAEFFDEYQRLLATRQPREKLGAVSGTWKWLCLEYFRSQPFKGLDERTQRVRMGVLHHTFEEPVGPDNPRRFATLHLEELTLEALRVLRDRKGSTLPEAANNRVKAIRAVFKWALEEKHVAFDPSRDLRRLGTASEGWHSWDVDEIARYEVRHPVGSKARLALALLMYTGARRSDVVLLGRQHVREGWLKFTARKNRRRKPAVIEIPVLPELQRVIDASPTGELAFLVTDYGQPFTANGFGGKFRQWCDQAGLPECSAHGLRKAAAALAAENGATTQQLMAIFGWLSLAEAERYTRAAKRKVLAREGMGLLVRNK